MSDPNPLAKLRRFVPLLTLVIILQAGFLVYALIAHKLPRVWPLVVGDLVFSGVLLFVLWRFLVRRRQG
ncbi:MAG: hypothetical protein NTU71_05290 [Verrucomicrobia bacterium]|jgi:hypothetical protein|nr:hypothetical protein [Verrucomicrobiota bacterium]